MKPQAPQPQIHSGEPGPGDWLAPADFAQVVRFTPLVSIDLVIRDSQGRALVGHRENEPAKAFYFVPGGRITKNETLAAAFERITAAELGCPHGIQSARFLGVFEHFYKQNRLQLPDFGTHYVVLAYELILNLEATTLPKDQHGHYAWMFPQELLERDDVHENTKAYFQEKHRAQAEP